MAGVGTKRSVQEKESDRSVRYGWVNLSLGSLFWHHSAEPRDAKNNDPWDRFAHPYLTLLSDSYIFSLGVLGKASSFVCDTIWIFAVIYLINPHVTNWLSHPYHLD